MRDVDASVIAAIASSALAAEVTGVRLIAVDGGSGAGKSTLARAVALRLDAPLIEIDDFVSWDEFDGWWPRFELQVLVPLFDGRDAVYQQRDWINDEFGRSLGAWRTVRWAPIVVIEGVTSTRQVVSDRLACRVWVECPIDVRLRRGLERDGEDHRALWEKWLIKESVFFENDKPKTRADFVVSGISGEIVLAET